MPVPFGIHAATGQPLTAPTPQILDQLTGRTPPPAADPETHAMGRRATPSAPTHGVSHGVDPNNLQQAGWGVIFGPSVDQRCKDALQPLLAHRSQASGALYRVFEGAAGYQPGDTAARWLARRRVRLELVNPKAGVPYHLLIVAPPSDIPFDFQYGLDIFWSVGRLWFDTAEEFRNYADSVVRYETMAVPPHSRQTALFAPRHDPATQLFHDHVASPLGTGSGAVKRLGQQQDFSLTSFLGPSATRDNFRDLLRAKSPAGSPALLFSGSHGMVFPSSDPRQSAATGALLCQDWTGGGASERHWFEAANVPDDANIHGMVYVMFSCYGAGWPSHDNFVRDAGGPPRIALQPMLARLPQKLLAHPNGGALAVLGHVDRAWSTSFFSELDEAQIQGFEDLIDGILLGNRLGQVTDQFNVRWSALGTELVQMLNDRATNKAVCEQELLCQWIAYHDARNYIIFGDPAVCLRVNEMPILNS